eukprot:TRINITY_DN5383_c0_g1_i1.p2 TRINITY_DN5383_c0_g1~~TRINITY_DN5383_c0_g1_i1.p2  ORF type:complete len:207 (-),score=93.20 TRINITY_DN5383_c0_g1_i1:89-709(-)
MCIRDRTSTQHLSIDVLIPLGETQIELVGRNVGEVVENVSLKKVYKEELFGNEGDDTIFGDAGDDFIDGGDQNDHVDGGEGDDLVCGADGDDTIVGGEGKDTLHGGEGYDVADYHGASEGIALALSDVDQYGIGGHFRNAEEGGLAGEAEGDEFIEIEEINGSCFDDTIQGADVGMVFDLNEGDDTFDTNYYSLSLIHISEPTRPY